MRLCNTDLQINCFTFSHLYVVVQLVWIAAFLVSTKFEHFRCQPPGKISYCCFGAPVLCTGALFCTLFLIRKRLRPYPKVVRISNNEHLFEVGLFRLSVPVFRSDISFAYRTPLPLAFNPVVEFVKNDVCKEWRNDSTL